MTKTSAESRFIERLKEHGACDEGLDWARQFASASEAWLACKNPVWMLWALERIGLLDERRARLFACACVRRTPLGDGRTTWDLLTDERSRNAVIVAERFADGLATTEELAVARAAARAAARSAARDAALDAARSAAWAAARSAVRDAARYAARSAALDAALAVQCCFIRELWGNPFAEK